MKALSLFSGIGGMDLAAEMAGIKTVAFCEIDKDCQEILKRRWPDTPIFNDVKGIDVRKFTEDFGFVDVVHGGYPCQPFSVAGKQRGKDDERHLWPAMRRIVRSLRPTWVIAENVKGHVTLGLDEVLSDLEEIGYCARPFVIPAVSVGASHTRERVFIVAHTSSDGRNERQVSRSSGSIDERATERQDEAVYLEGCSRVRATVEREALAAWGGGTEPSIRRMVDGATRRVDQARLKQVGNAVSPIQALPIFSAIMAVDTVQPLRVL